MDLWSEHLVCVVGIFWQNTGYVTLCALQRTFGQWRKAGLLEGQGTLCSWQLKLFSIQKIFFLLVVRDMSHIWCHNEGSKKSAIIVKSWKLYAFWPVTSNWSQFPDPLSKWKCLLTEKHPDLTFRKFQQGACTMRKWIFIATSTTSDFFKLPIYSQITTISSLSLALISQISRCAGLQRLTWEQAALHIGNLTQRALRQGASGLDSSLPSRIE